MIDISLHFAQSNNKEEDKHSLFYIEKFKNDTVNFSEKRIQKEPNQKYIPENTLNEQNCLANLSTCICNERSIETVSRAICFVISNFLPNIIPTDCLLRLQFPSKLGALPEEPQNFTNKLFAKIYRFLCFVQDSVKLTVAELAHAFNLICHYIQSECESHPEGEECVINHSTLGMLFLCGIIISLKMNRDHAIKNSFWAKALNIPLEVLNGSEVAFLEKINFCVYLEADEYAQLFSSLISVEEEV